MASHQRTQVGAADADIDHIGDRLAAVAAPLLLMDACNQPRHLVQILMHRINTAALNTLSNLSTLATGRHPEQGMQCSTRFRAVDRLAAKQRLDPVTQLLLLC